MNPTRLAHQHGSPVLDTLIAYDGMYVRYLEDYTDRGLGKGRFDFVSLQHYIAEQIDRRLGVGISCNIVRSVWYDGYDKVKFNKENVSNSREKMRLKNAKIETKFFSQPDRLFSAGRQKQVDVGMTVDILHSVYTSDPSCIGIVVLMAGDCDFVPLVHHLEHELNVRVVIAYAETPVWKDAVKAANRKGRATVKSLYLNNAASLAVDVLQGELLTVAPEADERG